VLFRSVRVEQACRMKNFKLAFQDGDVDVSVRLTDNLSENKV